MLAGDRRSPLCVDQSAQADWSDGWCLASTVRREDAPMSPSDLPRIGAPATRALASIGITRLDQVADRSEAELLELHGFGPKALRILRDALAAQDRSIRP